MGRFTGQSVLITGASGGLGEQLALDFAAEGAKVALNYASSKAKAEETAARIVATGGEALVCGADIARAEDVRSMVDSIVDQFGGIDILINNAGLSLDAPFLEMSEQDWDRVIDVNHYPVPEARRSNLRHRPMGIGVQGLADTFLLLKMPFDSPEARELNRDIFETIYFAAVSASCELAEVEGTYETYEGSPASRGQLQFDLWGVEPSARHDWAGLKARIARHGLRSSLLVAPMQRYYQLSSDDMPSVTPD